MNKKLAWTLGGVGVCLVAAALAFPLLLKTIYYLQAPKFSTIHYVGTDASYGCLAYITDAVCTTTYKYTATGTEKEIASGLMEELKGRGYGFGYKAGIFDTDVVCGTESVGDIYSFAKQH